VEKIKYSLLHSFRDRWVNALGRSGLVERLVLANRNDNNVSYIYVVYMER